MRKGHKKPGELTAEQLAKGLIISSGEARKLMGKDAKGFSDDELNSYIFDLTSLAQELLKATNLRK